MFEAGKLGLTEAVIFTSMLGILFVVWRKNA
jgi:hypothetical protein